MRITIKDSEHKILKELLAFTTLNTKQREVVESLLNKIEKEKNKEVSPKKVSAAKKATETRTKEARVKIENALNLMRLEQKGISVYSVAKEARVSYNTANKYKNIIIASI